MRGDDMPQTAELNIDKEIEHRRVVQRNMQIEMDMAELERRASDVEAGRSRLISQKEFWDNVQEHLKTYKTSNTH
jgi:hypothetical protein